MFLGKVLLGEHSRRRRSTHQTFSHHKINDEMDDQEQVTIASFQQWWHKAATEANSDRPPPTARSEAFTTEHLRQIANTLELEIPLYQYKRLEHFSEIGWRLDRLDMVAVFGLDVCKSKRLCDTLRDLARLAPSLGQALASLREARRIRTGQQQDGHRKSNKHFWTQSDATQAVGHLQAAAAPATNATPSANTSTRFSPLAPQPQTSAGSSLLEAVADHSTPRLRQASATSSTPDDEAMEDTLTAIPASLGKRRRTLSEDDAMSPSHKHQHLTLSRAGTRSRILEEEARSILDALSVFVSPNTLLAFSAQDVGRSANLGTYTRFCAFSPPDEHLFSFSVAFADVQDGQASLWVTHENSSARDLLHTLLAELQVSTATVELQHRMQHDSEDPSSLIPAAAATAAHLSGRRPLETVSTAVWRHAFHTISELQSGNAAPPTSAPTVDGVMQQARKAAEVQSTHISDESTDELALFKANVQHIRVLSDHHISFLSKAGDIVDDYRDQVGSIASMVAANEKLRQSLVDDLEYVGAKLKLAMSNESSQSIRDRAALEEQCKEYQGRLRSFAKIPANLRLALDLTAEHYKRASKLLHDACTDVQKECDNKARA